MQLTKNEKKTLKLLLENARVTDSQIAEKLNISSQAVGKIRRKLEENVIKRYTVDVDYNKLGVQTFAVALGKMTPKGLEKGGLEVEAKLSDNPHIISAYRIPRGNASHLLTYGFGDLSELDLFFQSQQVHDDLHQFIEVQDLFTFSHNSLIKNSPLQLLQKSIDSLGTKTGDSRFIELERFKKKILQ